jgi:hypothetical protein
MQTFDYLLKFVIIALVLFSSGWVLIWLLQSWIKQSMINEAQYEALYAKIWQRIYEYPVDKPNYDLLKRDLCKLG